MLIVGMPYSLPLPAPLMADALNVSGTGIPIGRRLMLLRFFHCFPGAVCHVLRNGLHLVSESGEAYFCAFGLFSKRPGIFCKFLRLSEVAVHAAAVCTDKGAERFGDLEGTNDDRFVWFAGVCATSSEESPCRCVLCLCDVVVLQHGENDDDLILRFRKKCLCTASTLVHEVPVEEECSLSACQFVCRVQEPVLTDHCHGRGESKAKIGVEPLIHIGDIRRERKAYFAIRAHRIDFLSK